MENSLVKLKILQKLKKKRRIRQKTHVIYWNKLIYGEFHHLYPQLRADEKPFRQYTRMTINTFDYIVEKIHAACYQCTTNFQRPISAIACRTTTAVVISNDAYGATAQHRTYRTCHVLNLDKFISYNQFDRVRLTHSTHRTARTVVPAFTLDMALDRASTVIGVRLSTSRKQFENR
jgi:hypothetical protein